MGEKRPHCSLKVASGTGRRCPSGSVLAIAEWFSGAVPTSCAGMRANAFSAKGAEKNKRTSPRRRRCVEKVLRSLRKFGLCVLR